MPGGRAARMGRWWRPRRPRVELPLGVTRRIERQQHGRSDRPSAGRFEGRRWRDPSGRRAIAVARECGTRTGTSKKTPSTVTWPHRCGAGRGVTSVREARRRASELGLSRPTLGGPAQVAGERALADLGCHSLRWYSSPTPGPGWRSVLEQLERQLGLALEHGQEAAFDLSPERFLFSVLLGRIGQRRVVDDAQALEALDSLGGGHRGAVVGHKRAWKPALVKGL